MNTELERRKQEISRTQGRRKLWQRVVSALAAVVMFVTTYVLILPVEAQNRTFCEKEAHEHSAENGCYVETKTLKCEEEHEHTDECYITLLTLICQHEEHIHNKECYADKTADVETQQDWEASIKAAKLTGNWSEDILAVASTQLGYRESDKNYIVNEENEIQGYNRYAAWVSSTNAEFGQYSPWSAAFVAFCLHFAKVDEAELQRTPYPAQWGELMKAYEKLNADAKNAQPGDILFIDANDDEIADRVAIVAENNDGKIKAVEGDLNNAVAYFEYQLSAQTARTDVEFSSENSKNKDFSSEKSTTGRTVGKIIGFVALPENPNYTAPTPDPNAPGNRINETAAPEATDEPGGDRETAAPTQEPINKTTPEPHAELEAEYNYSLLGKTELTLSKMFAELNIPRSVLLVDSVLSSSPALVGVRRTADDWLISSAVSFTSSEQLSIEFINGEATLIHLTDIPARGIGDAYQPGTAEVTAVNVRAVTGTAPFDADNNPGNDQNATNDVVRSFDTVFYKVGYTLNIIDKYGTAINGFKKANLYIEATLPLTEDKAVFDLDAMPWLTDAQIANSASGQTLTGYYAMDAGSFDYVVPSTGTLSIAVFVKGMANGETVQPSFSIYLDAGGEKSATPQMVTVSAAAKYNIAIMNLSNTVDDQSGGQGIAFVNVGVAFSAANSSSEKGRKGLWIDCTSVRFQMVQSFYLDGQYYPQIDPYTYSPAFVDYSPINGSQYGVNGTDLTAAFLYPERALGLYQLPYSYRSLGSAENSTLNSGDMSAAFVQGQAIWVEFSNITFDDAFPSSSASGNTTSIGSNSLLLAVGLVKLRVPGGIPNDSHTRTVRIQAANLSINGGTSVADSVSSDNMFEVAHARPVTPGGIKHAGAIVDNRTYASHEWDFATSGQDLCYVGDENPLIAAVGSNGTPIRSADAFFKLWGPVEPVPGSEARAEAFNHWNAYPDYMIDDVELKTLYVAKPDGSGWSSITELVNTHMTATSHLLFFTSMEALKQQLGEDAVCIGVWLEVRRPNNIPLWSVNGEATNYCHFHAIPCYVKISDTAQHGEYVYCITETRSYSANIASSREFSANLPRSTNYYATVPSGYDASLASSTDVLYCWRYVGGTYASSGNATSWHYTELWHNNSYLGRSWGEQVGSTLYVMGARQEIDKQVAQQTNGLPRSVFFVETGERSVDYVLSPATVLPPTAPTRTTTVTVTDTLPKGLTLMKDSATGQYYCNFGGTYNQPSNRTSSGTVSGDTTVIFAGQTATGIATSATTTGDVSFTVTENANGTTTLTWTITNVEIGQEMPKIYYSAHIGNENNPLSDVANGQQLANTASIVSEANAVASSSTATITVFKLESATLIKRVSTPTPDVNGDVVYTIDYINDSTETLSSIDIRDILPFNNDPRGSSFHGSYTVDTVTVERMNEAAGSYAMGYTTDTAVQGYVGNMYAAGFSPSLTDASASVSGMTTTFTLPANTTPTMLAFTGSGVGAGAVIRITVTLHPSGNKHGDIYYNDAAYNTATIPAPVYAVPVSASVVQQHMSLTVTEEIIGGDAGTAFPFTVAVTDGTGNNIYQVPDGDIKVYDAAGNDITPATISRDTNGNPIITLGNGDYVEISNIPANYIATVTETGYDGYSVDISGDGTATAADSGITHPIVMNRDKTVHYLNERSTVELTITKTVVGGGTGPFSFTVTFTDASGDPVNIPAPAANSGYTVAGNVASFNLMKDGSVTITGIPVDTVATIVETSHNGYTVQYNFSDGSPSVSGDTATVTITDDLTVTCINNAGFELPHTGGGGTLILTFSGAILMATALTYGMAVRRRRERREFTY